MSRRYENLIFREIFWPRPIEENTPLDFAKRLATFPHHQPLIWEIHGNNHELHFFLGGEKCEIALLKPLLQLHGVELGKNLPAENDFREKVSYAREIGFSSSEMSFNVEENPLLTRSTLAVLADAGENEMLVFQLLIGRSFSPSLAPGKFPKPSPSLWQILSGIPEATSAEKDAMKEKISFAKMNAAVRIGAFSENEWKAQNALRGLFASLKLLESAGVKIKQKVGKINDLNFAKIPLRFQNRLSVAEISNLFLLPVGEENYRGLSDIHPKLMLPSQSYFSRKSRSFAISLNQNEDERKFLNLPIRQALKHLHVIGPTGAGKSVVLENLILSDIREGRGCVVIDPKYSLIQSLAEKIPENRLNDVVILDPTSPNPVGLNPFSYTERKSPELLAETVILSLTSLIPDFGIYTRKMLTGGILTLAKSKNATLLQLPLLFSNDKFREKMTQNLDDFYLKKFWQDFAKLSPQERRTQLAPLLNRLDPLQVRQSLVGVLGQEKPKFDLREVFTKNKILLIPLNSGLVGKEVSEFLASLVIGLLWDITLKRASGPENSRKPTVLYIDEFQNYLKKSAADVGEMLAMARSLGLGFCFAHQNLEQLPRDLRETIMTNARSKICFNLAKWDAREFMNLSESLTETDFMKLPQYQIYAKLETENGSTDFISGKAFPPRKSLRDAVELFAKSAENYGGDRNEIEVKILEMFQETEEFSGTKLTRKPTYMRDEKT